MLTVQYKGNGERTIGTQVVYPGELLNATPNLLAAWQAEHGDVFVVVRGDEPATVEADSTTAADQPVEQAATPVTSKAKRK